MDRETNGRQIIETDNKNKNRLQTDRWTDR